MFYSMSFDQSILFHYPIDDHSYEKKKKKYKIRLY